MEDLQKATDMYHLVKDSLGSTTTEAEVTPDGSVKEEPLPSSFAWDILHDKDRWSTVKYGGLEFMKEACLCQPKFVHPEIRKVVRAGKGGESQGNSDSEDVGDFKVEVQDKTNFEKSDKKKGPGTRRYLRYNFEVDLAYKKLERQKRKEAKKAK